MKKISRFGFVLTDDEKQALARLAEIEGGLSEAATVRRLIRRAARDCGVWQGKTNVVSRAPGAPVPAGA